MSIALKFIPLAFFLSACGSIYDDYYALSRTRPDNTDPKEIRDYVKPQNEALLLFAHLGGVTDLNPYLTEEVKAREAEAFKQVNSIRSDDWKLVYSGAQNFFDASCDDYMDKIYNAENERSFLVNLLSILNTATLGAMGTLEAASKATALVGATFGLSTGYVNNQYDSVLERLNKTSVRTFVKKLRTEKIKEMKGKEIMTRHEAVSAIQSYGEYCVPSFIVDQINQDIAKPSS